MVYPVITSSCTSSRVTNRSLSLSTPQPVSTSPCTLWSFSWETLLTMKPSKSCHRLRYRHSRRRCYRCQLAALLRLRKNKCPRLCQCPPRLCRPSYQQHRFHWFRQYHWLRRPCHSRRRALSHSVSLHCFILCPKQARGRKTFSRCFPPSVNILSSSIPAFSLAHLTTE